MELRDHILCLFSFIVNSMGQCPPGAYYFASTDRCFEYISTNVSWYDAQAFCEQDRGGNLVSIHSKAENDFIYTVVANKSGQCSSGACLSTWIGLYYPTWNHHDYKYQWSDGSELDYQNWEGDAQPADEYCVLQFWANPGWIDDYCRHFAPFVCEVPKGPPSPTPKRPKSCPPGSLTNNGKCYFFDDVPSNWDDSRVNCMKQGGDLVSVHSQAENRFISTNAKRLGLSVFWIGLNKELGSATNFTWSDGTSTYYQNWNTGVPTSCQNGAQNCVNIETGSSQWYNCWECGHPLPYVCELPMIH